ncbi:hypothetical protein PHYC_01765 [Phycisphaerales bacterium]|nr:hypothetical protein PHYC_01765 [Phycisphaerales bacterium]
MTTLATISVTAPPSQRLLRACAAFGLGVRRAQSLSPPSWFKRAAGRLERNLARGDIALITGRSGSGKSTILREIQDRLSRERRPFTRITPAPAGTAVIDLVQGPLGEALATLARVGLGDATLLGRGADQLSEGERFRLSLAVALSMAGPEATILCDEFTSGLDRTTARCVAMGVRRWATRAAARVICATSHDDVVPWLAPDLVARCDYRRIETAPGGGR